MAESVNIVGAGLVGSFLGALLVERGYRVRLSDRQADPRGSEVAAGRSINITLAHRGLAALDGAGAGQTIRPLAIPAFGRRMHSPSGEVTWQPYGNDGEAIHSISRTDLHQSLLDFAESRGVEMHFGEKCVGIDLERPAVRLLDLDSGEERTIASDRLLGCDGAFSAVRLQLQRLRRFDFSQHYLDQGYKELTAPAEQCRDLDRQAIHIWPRGGFMLIGFANLDGSFTLALHLPFEGDPSFESISGRAELEYFFADQFPDAVELVPDLARDYFDRPVSHMVTVRCFPWSRGDRVVLFGDAAHAIVPSYGQGANSSFEDCAFFCARLDDAGGDWAAAIAAYEEERKPNAEAIADLSLDHFHELREFVGDPEFLLRKSVERVLAELEPQRFMPLYNRVSFSATSYVEAVAAERSQRKVVDRVLATDGVAEAFANGGGARLVSEVLGLTVSPARTD